MSDQQKIQAEEKIESAKSHVVDSLAETMDLYGITRSTGTLYGTMYFEGDMTLDEMREKLGMSKPSMSTGVKKLQEFDIVKNTFRKGTRKHTYVAEKDFFRFFTNFFTEKWKREVKVNLDAIKRAQSELEDVIENEEVEQELREQALQIFQQLEMSKPYYDWLMKLVQAIESGEIFDRIPVDDQEE